MSDLPKIGELIKTDSPRDAIHIAVAPVVAAEMLMPGEHIGFKDATNMVVSLSATKMIGIVDPYLKDPVKAGEKFWMFLYPNTVTSLRHDWAHPAFNGAQDISNAQRMQMDESKKYIEELADEVGVSYDALITGAEDWVRSQARGEYGDYMVGGSEMEGSYVPDAFWDHYERATGKPVPADHRGSFFSCSC